MTILTAYGLSGQMSVDDNFVVINRRGAGAKLLHGLKGEKRIPLTSVTSVQFKRASTMAAGFIQIGILGGNEGIGGVLGASYDENTVTFKKGQESTFLKIREKIEASIVDRGKPQIVVLEKQTSVTQSEPSSKLDQLRQLGELRDAGILTEEEFEIEKAKILSS